MMIQLVQFETVQNFDEILKVAEKRKPEYAAIPALRQKYYLKLQKPNHYGGLMIWDSADDIAAFRDSDLAKTIGTSYGVTGAPDVSVYDVMFPLR